MFQSTGATSTAQRAESDGNQANGRSWSAAFTQRLNILRNVTQSKQLKDENKRLKEEINNLRARNKSLEDSSRRTAGDVFLLINDMPPQANDKANTATTNDSNLKGFHLTHKSNNNLDCRIIGDLITKTVPKLRKVKIESNAGITNFECIVLPKLESLELQLSGTIYCTHRSNEQKILVKSLQVKTHDISDVNLAVFLSNFASVEELEFSLRGDKEFKFTSNVVNALCNFRSLKKFTFRHSEYKTDKYTTVDVGGEKNALLEAVTALHTVSTFNIHLRPVAAFEFNEMYKSLVRGVIPIARIRLSHSFNFTIGKRSQQLPFPEYPKNMVVKYVEC